MRVSCRHQGLVGLLDHVEETLQTLVGRTARRSISRCALVRLAVELSERLTAMRAHARHGALLVFVMVGLGCVALLNRHVWWVACGLPGVLRARAARVDRDRLAARTR